MGLGTLLGLILKCPRGSEASPKGFGRGRRGELLPTGLFFVFLRCSRTVPDPICGVRALPYGTAGSFIIGELYAADNI